MIAITQQVQRQIIAAGESGVTRPQLYALLPQITTQQVGSALLALRYREAIVMVEGKRPQIYVAVPGATLSRKASPSPPLMAGSQRSHRKRVLLADVEVDYSRAKITRDLMPRPTAAWQMQPSHPPIFANIPLGATLDARYGRDQFHVDGLSRASATHMID